MLFLQTVLPVFNRLYCLPALRPNVKGEKEKSHVPSPTSHEEGDVKRRTGKNVSRPRSHVPRPTSHGEASWVFLRVFALCRKFVASLVRRLNGSNFPSPLALHPLPFTLYHLSLFLLLPFGRSLRPGRNGFRFGGSLRGSFGRSRFRFRGGLCLCGGRFRF